MILIIDFGMGNLRSVQKAFELYSDDVRISSDYKDIEKADKVILPGVSAFGDAINKFNKLNLKEPLLNFIEKGNPFLGICVGLQMLFSTSEEKGLHKGLDIISGDVIKFPVNELKIPQIGWNQVSFNEENPLFKGVQQNSFFYFVHSYYVSPSNKSCSIGETEYGITYTSAIAKENVFGVQFHPEKSQKAGLKVVENFCNI